MFLAEGRGRSKKDAKQAAAKALIDQLAGVTVSNEFYFSPRLQSSTSRSSTLKPSKVPRHNIEIRNFVGAVLDYAAQKKLNEPVYELETETGPAQDKHFTVRCTFDNLTSSGSGATKKIAKQQAGEDMWNLIVRLNPDA